MMTLNQINYLNITLMLLSCLLAFILPFELFLFSYAVLGPLHYLTEISWLHDKGYYSQSKPEVWILFASCLVIFLFSSAFYELCVYLGIPNPFEMKGGGIISTSALFFAFGAGLCMAFIKKKEMRILGYVLTGFLTLVFHTTFNKEQLSNGYFLLFAVLTPTIIHVFIFTGLFILSGAVKSKSGSAMLSLLVFVGCAVLFFLTGTTGFQVDTYVQEAYKPFRLMNYGIMEVLGIAEMPAWDTFFSSPVSIKIARLIAFSYTYHYLNWFSKTTVIKWHEVPKKRLAWIAVGWVSAVGIYAVDYKLGLNWLLFLSMLHVLLEFPLNHKSTWQTIRDIFSRPATA